MPYNFWLSQSAAQFIDQMSSRRRKKLLDECLKIAASPLSFDRQENQRGFLNYYKRSASWMILYRVDEPVEGVMILEIIELK